MTGKFQVSAPPCAGNDSPSYSAEIPLLGMRASSDRPLSALFAIVGTVIFFGLLIFVVGKLGLDDGLSARADSEAITTE